MAKAREEMQAGSVFFSDQICQVHIHYLPQESYQKAFKEMLHIALGSSDCGAQGYCFAHKRNICVSNCWVNDPSKSQPWFWHKWLECFPNTTNCQSPWPSIWSRYGNSEAHSWKEQGRGGEWAVKLANRHGIEAQRPAVHLLANSLWFPHGSPPRLTL